MVSKATVRDTSIRTYRAKRDFAVTAEPAPGPAQPPAPAPMFVIQKHHAHRAGLHWDLRLEHGGVLWSWAVRKGPSLDPADRRMAVYVEDHPIEYADFEGTIPDGQYGSGKVETWDRGIWTPLEDPEESMQKGHLRFELSGQRLHGRFTLARLKQRDPKKQEGLFLIKGRDEAAREGVDALTLEQKAPFSAAPGTLQGRKPAAALSRARQRRGLISMAQMSAIELHAWGANETDPSRPDQLVFDLDPGDGVPWPEVVKAAHDVRDRLRRVGLTSFCRTTGGKGLHVVAPLRPEAGRSPKAWRRKSRTGSSRILRSRIGVTAFSWTGCATAWARRRSPASRRAPGATVATPVAWDEVTPKLDPSTFSVRTVPERLTRLKTKPWNGFGKTDQRLPDLVPKQILAAAKPAPASSATTTAAKGKPVIVVASKPKPRR